MTNGTFLHLGCFDCPVDGWINTDVTPHILVSRVPGAAAALRRVGRMSDARYEQHRAGVFSKVRRLDVSKRFPFADQSVDAIFSAHLLEHLPQPVAENLVTEARRVLRPRGVMRIGVPDLDLLVAGYRSDAPEAMLDGIYESRQQGKNRHHWMYTESSLRRLLVTHGFGRVERRHYREGDCPNLDELDNRPETTLFVEAYPT